MPQGRRVYLLTRSSGKSIQAIPLAGETVALISVTFAAKSSRPGCMPPSRSTPRTLLREVAPYYLFRGGTVVSTDEIWGDTV
jgi:hypothetical protein